MERWEVERMEAERWEMPNGSHSSPFERPTLLRRYRSTLGENVRLQSTNERQAPKQENGIAEGQLINGMDRIK